MPESSSSSGFTYRAFISYSHRDKAWGDWLHRSLETYRVPSRLVGKQTEAGVIPRRLNPIFRDRDELASATDLGRKINEALAQSENLIVICSPHAAASHWVNEEVLAYKRTGRAERIFCLIVDGEPNASDLPGRAAEECFCPALRFKLDANGQAAGEPAEPIAADARPGKDGKNNAKLKLIAGMLDVGFDALKQREQHRKMRRMTAITALAIIVMAVTIVLAVFALISRRHALLARHQAVVAQQAAERRQKQAEGLVGFMLGDLNDKLAQVDRLDILQDVDDKAMAYFASLPAADATDSALAMRVTALEKIGSVRMDQGKTPAALQAYQVASTLAAELARRAPDDADRQTAYADSLKWVGQAYWYQGDLAHALQKFEAASVLLQKAAARKPDDDLAFELAVVRNDAGHVQEARGDLVAAQHNYAAYLQIFELLRRHEPGNLKWQSYTGNAWDNLGKIKLEQGHLDQAIADYRADQRIKAALAAQAPNNHSAQEDLLVSNAILGRTLALCGDLPVALHYTRAAVDSAKTAVAFDPTNADMQEYMALYSQQLGGLLRQTGQTAAAAAADAEATQTFAKLVAKDKSRTDWQQEYAQASIEAARLQWRQGDATAARSLATAALQNLNALRQKRAADRSLMLLAAQADLLIGKIAVQRDDLATARTASSRALQTLAPALQTGNDPNVVATAASAWLLLGETKQARPLIAKLAAMGYRTPDFVALLATRHIAYVVDGAATQRIAVANQEPVTSKMHP